MKVRDLREKYLRFFETKGHQRFPAASLIPYDVTGKLDDTLLFNGAGMIQFKPYFRGVARPDHLRLMTCQPCVRTNDIEEVGDDTHLSFFEMLGNFSFGDYFKSQTIAFSWEFITAKEWLGLDPRRVSYTVFESDDEAYDEWASWLRPAGIDPATRIFRLDEDSNYWPAGAFTHGPPGPCGPNSEMFYWVADEPAPEGPYSKEDWMRDEAAGKWMEFWNDVFITYDWHGHLRDPSNPKKGYQKDGMPELPFRSIDTGMGLERTAVVLGGYDSVYDTDVFAPILAVLHSLRGGTERTPAIERAERIIADHLRTAAFCIADGILPGNNGRGYVLRRLIRRAVLQGQRALGFDKPFLPKVYEGLLESMGDFYTSLHDRRELIVQTLVNEEEQFRRTLTLGISRLEEVLRTGSYQGRPAFDDADGGKQLKGDVAFQFYDTFGFPLEVTQELAAEAGASVDVAGYSAALEVAQSRSRAGQDIKGAYDGMTVQDELAVPDAAATDFVGYEEPVATGRIVRVRPASGDRVLLALDATPFYAESGGQVGDHGVLVLVGGPDDGATLEVVNTTKSAGVFWHEVRNPGITPTALLGHPLRAQVLSRRRDRVRRNHTATHLLHAALRQVLGTHVTQAGSYVGPDYLRFDFTHGKALTEDEKTRVERIVNEQILVNNHVVTYADLPISEARAKGAMALFGEKYGDKVRMVEVGEFSRELCGGIHVRTTGEVGQFRIVSESSSQSGVRRIEGVTGEAAYNLALEESARIAEATALLKASPKELVTAVERLIEQNRDERRRREKAEIASLRSGSSSDNEILEIQGVKLWRRNFGEVDPKVAAQAVDNAAALDPLQVTLAVVSSEGKLTFIAKAGPDAVAQGAHAGNLLREVAKVAGGGGGGRADFATAGGKVPEKAAEALESAAKVLAGQLGG